MQRELAPSLASLTRKSAVAALPVLALALLASLLLSVAPASAGGAATVTLVEQPDEIVAGEETTLTLEILQHGRTPIDWEVPTLSAINMASGERVNATGEAGETLGTYVFDVTFPTDGEWSWAVTLSQLAVIESTFAPFTVANGGAAAAGASSEVTTAEMSALTADLAALDTTVQTLQSDLIAANAEREGLRGEMAALRSDADATETTTRWLLAGLVIVSAVLIATVVCGVLAVRRTSFAGNARTGNADAGAARERVLAD